LPDNVGDSFAPSPCDPFLAHSFGPEFPNTGN
jgi:hypothetical protein